MLRDVGRRKRSARRACREVECWICMSGGSGALVQRAVVSCLATERSGVLRVFESRMGGACMHLRVVRPGRKLWGRVRGYRDRVSARIVERGHSSSHHYAYA